MTEPVDLAQLAAELKAETAHLRQQPEPSAPTPFIGAPDIGVDWRNAWDDVRIAADRAFGEDA